LAGIEQARSFGWHDTALRTLNAYRLAMVSMRDEQLAVAE